MDILKNQGKLSKLRITPYKKEDYNESEKASKVGEFTVLANPEKYSLDYKVNYNEEKASGANADNPKFESSDSPNLTFDFVFDGTGVLQEAGTAKKDVISQIEEFKKVVFEYEGEIHKPYHVKIAWGSLIFHGVLTSMTIEFKLFAPSGSDVLRVPEFVTRNTLYYRDNWFRGNPLLVQMGATFKYFSKYKANAYNPLLGDFTIQNNTEIGYPTVDLFFNSRVRRTRIYLKADNISSFFFKKDYLSAPNYPYRDFVIRFGVVWNWFI